MGPSFRVPSARREALDEFEGRGDTVSFCRRADPLASLSPKRAQQADVSTLEPSRRADSSANPTRLRSGGDGGKFETGERSLKRPLVNEGLELRHELGNEGLDVLGGHVATLPLR